MIIKKIIKNNKQVHKIIQRLNKKEKCKNLSINTACPAVVFNGPKS